jgi:hypothetical protein
MVKTKQMRYRIDARKAKMYEDTLKSLGINPKDDYDRYVSEVIRTRGIAARELLGNELKAQSEQILAQVKIDRMNLHEAFTEGIIIDVDKALARTDREGRIRTHTFESLEYFIKQISEKHHVPRLSILVCMRQRIHNFYADNRGELDRLLKTLEELQDVIDIEVKT